MSGEDVASMWKTATTVAIAVAAVFGGIDFGKLLL